MSLSKIFQISGSALQAQAQRLNTVASNLANADTVAAPGEQPYRARQVLFRTQPLTDAGASPRGVPVAGVAVSEAAPDSSPARRQYDPKHPYADAQGYVTTSNVNVVDEMVNMISASRSYQNNIEVLNTAKTLLAKTLTLGS